MWTVDPLEKKKKKKTCTASLSQTGFVLSMGEHIPTLSKGGLSIRKCLFTTDRTGLCCDANTELAIFKVYNPSEKQWACIYRGRAFKINYPTDNGNRNAASDTIHLGCTVRAKVRVKRKEDRNKLHQLHIQQPTVISASATVGGRQKGKSPETHYRGYTTVRQSMSLNTL